MKIGDYVRTPYGIARIKNIFCETGYVFIETDNEIGDCSMVNKGVLRKGIIVMENDYANFRENNVKERPIDLIEVGDYVNGHKVVEVDLDDIDDYGNDFRYIKAEHDYTLNYWIKEYEIESVLTKEQFESMKYRVGE